MQSDLEEFQVTESSRVKPLNVQSFNSLVGVPLQQPKARRTPKKKVALEESASAQKLEPLIFEHFSLLWTKAS